MAQPRSRAKRGKRRSKASEDVLPAVVSQWFSARGWTPRPHQLALIEHGRARRSSLLIAPTGAGKTLAGFLPSIVDLLSPRPERSGSGLHTLYISPLKALAVDIARNLDEPLAEMALRISVETRTSDTSVAKRRRQRARPPDIMLTTPEQLALLLSHDDAGFLFADLKTVVLDELHALAASKRGDLLALDIARLRTLAPALVVTGLSATVARPTELRSYVVPQLEPETAIHLGALVQVIGGAEPDLSILEGDDPLPWSGHTARYAMSRVYDAIKAHRLSLVFVNTRSQAEMVFQQLWRLNEDGLAIALHHGSLDAQQRRKVEAAMAAGTLKAVVATSTLDLGIDWGDVDLVVHVGAPKGASRLLQRIGRSNHRLDEPSKAILVPSNRFEVLECRAALDAARSGTQDAVLNRIGALDVLAQHVMGVACSGPFHPDALFDEVRTATPYATLRRDTFDRVVDFVATGGYALRSYERFARLRPTSDGLLRLAHPRLAQQHRLNAGTIVDSPMLKVRMIKPRTLRADGPSRAGQPRRTGRQASPPVSSGSAASTQRAFAGGRVLGEIDEWFAGELVPGDTFIFAGEILRFEGLRDTDLYASRTKANDPAIPSYPGGKFPLSTHLAARVRAMLSDSGTWTDLPEPVAEWLALQATYSLTPDADDMLVETFPRGDRWYMTAYPFEGRLAHQTLGMLLTRRMDRAGARPLGFVANDYGLSVWCASSLDDLMDAGQLSLSALFSQDMLGDDLEAWLAESTLMKRTFRMCAVIAGLVERRHPGKEKSGRQMTISSDLIYDVLRRHDPRHILLEATWQDAATGLLDIARLGEFLARIEGRIRYARLHRVSPLSVPILLEIGKEPVSGQTGDALLRDAAAALIAEAMGETPD
ncbi:MAG: ligase-associated DNA damage response DEXH box helicase [Pseudomonadota bacterium]